MRATRLAPLATTLLLVASGVTACSDDPDPDPGASASPTPEATSSSANDPSRPTIEITFEGDAVTPNGERVAVPMGEKIDLVVTADEPDELHVHATPEQELAYGVGTTTLPLVIDQPGIVEVESHGLGLVVVQLEVR